MSKHIRAAAAPAALLLSLTLGACQGGDAKRDTMTLGADTSLSNDLALAYRDSLGQLTLTDVPDSPPVAGTATPPPAPPRAPAPAKTAPAPVKTAPAPTKTTPTPPATTPSGNVVTTPPATGTGATGGAVGSVAAGTTMRLASSTKICTNTQAVGDRVTATTTERITGTNGVSIPAGSAVTLEVTRLKRSENVNDPIVMEFRVISLRSEGKSYALNASVTDADITRVRDQPADKDVQKVVGGAVIGAIAGRVLGGNTRSTVGGAAAGAAAGAATAAATANYQGCIDAGSRIVVRLDAPVEIVRT